MSPIAGQSAGPSGLTFLVDTQGSPRGVLGLKNRFFFVFKVFLFSIFFPGQRRKLQLVLNKPENI